MRVLSLIKFQSRPLYNPESIFTIKIIEKVRVFCPEDRLLKGLFYIWAKRYISHSLATDGKQYGQPIALLTRHLSS